MISLLPQQLRTLLNELQLLKFIILHLGLPQIIQHLIVGDLAITILVHLTEKVLDSSIWQLDTHAFEHGSEFS